MALEKNIKLKVTADTKQAEQNLGKVDKSISGIGLSLKTMGAALIAGFGANFIKDSIQGFIEAERVASKLNNTMGYNASGLREYAKELQNKTRYEYDAIISGMALLGIFTKDEELIKRVTKATLDLATDKQLDLNTAFEMTSKAITGNVIAFGKMGIKIDDTGTSTEKLEKLLLKINSLMGGSASAEKNTTFGRVESLKNEFDSLQDSIGEGLTPALTGLISTLNNLITLNWDGLITNLSDLGMTISDFVSGRTATKNRLMPLIEQMNNVKDLMNRNSSYINNFFEALQSGTEETTKSTKELIKEWEKIQTIAKGKDQWFASNAGGLAGAGIGEGQSDVLGFSGSGMGKGGRDKRFKQFVEDNQFFIEQMQSDIQILQGAFNEFWTNTFGEANSLLEKFLQNFANGLLDLASQSLLSGILNFLLPGAGTLAGQALGGRSQTIQNNIIIDGRQTAIIYTNGKYNAQRLRLD